MRGGHKGLQWCGFAWFLVRFCGNFYFKLRYCSFTKPSSVCRFLICYSVWCFYVFLWGFAVFVPALRPPPINGSVFSNGPLIIFEIPYCYCGIQGNLRHLKEWDIILQAQTFYCITTTILNILNRAVIVQRTQQGPSNTITANYRSGQVFCKRACL